MGAKTITAEPTEFGTLITAWTVFKHEDSERETYILAYNKQEPEKSWINELGEFWGWDELIDVEPVAPF